jgi:hypothetical protein
MRSFSCQVCGNILVAENSVCMRCGTAQGLSPVLDAFLPVDTEAGRSLDGGRRQCANLAAAGCNWLVDDDRRDGLCASCRLTRVRPHDGDAAGLAAWASTESAKRRLVYQLLDLALPVVPLADEVGGLAFELLSSAEEPVTTGHANGVVTIDLAEGHDAHREALRLQMGEPYRTVLGHLRHEVGHYYWQVLVPEQAPENFRSLFGEEGLDYAEALKRHYGEGAPPNWVERYVSAYATAHPWEDWAETFAHYLHIRDTLQTAASYGMVVTGPRPAGSSGAGDELTAVPSPMGTDAALTSIDEIVATWLPLTYALNAVNRSMGRGDLYPFVLAPPVVAKLGFVHDLVSRRRVGPR